MSDKNAPATPATPAAATPTAEQPQPISGSVYLYQSMSAWMPKPVNGEVKPGIEPNVIRYKTSGTDVTRYRLTAEQGRQYINGTARQRAAILTAAEASKPMPSAVKSGLPLTRAEQDGFESLAGGKVAAAFAGLRGTVIVPAGTRNEAATATEADKLAAYSTMFGVNVTADDIAAYEAAIAAAEAAEAAETAAAEEAAQTTA